MLVDIAKYKMQNCDLKEAKKGQTAHYVELNPLWAVKFFEHKEDRDHTYRLQKYASEHFAAPPVGEVLVVTRKNKLGLSTTFWGYITGVAKVDKNIPSDKMKELRDRLLVIGIKWNDRRKVNCGWYNGKVVCIDFDCEVLEYEHILP
jgi:hypothetical protein